MNLDVMSVQSPANGERRHSRQTAPSSHLTVAPPPAFRRQSSPHDPSDLSDVQSDDGDISPHRPARRAATPAVDEDSLSSVDSNSSSDGSRCSTPDRPISPAHASSDLNVDSLSSSSRAASQRDGRRLSGASSHSSVSMHSPSAASSSSAGEASLINITTATSVARGGRSASDQGRVRNTTHQTAHERDTALRSYPNSRSHSPLRSGATTPTGRRRGGANGASSTAAATASAAPNRPAYDVDKRDRSGRSRLFKAAVKGQIELVNELIQAGANLNMKDNAGWTPLHEAVTEKQVAIVEILLRAGANPNMQGLGGDTPLHDAVDVENLQLVKLLLRYGATPFIRNDSSREPIHNAEQCTIDDPQHASDCQLPEIRNTIVFYCKLEDALHRRDAHGMTFLHRLCLENRVEMVQELVECRKVDVHTADNAGWTPLHEAALQGHYEIADILLRNGADANARSHSGDTPLHDASCCGHTSILRLLLEHNGDPSIANDEDDTPLSLASSPEAAKVLGTTPNNSSSQANGGKSWAPRKHTRQPAHQRAQSADAANAPEHTSYQTTAAGDLASQDEVMQDADNDGAYRAAESIVSSQSGATEWAEDGGRQPQKLGREERKLLQIVQSIERLEQRGQRRRVKREDGEGANASAAFPASAASPARRRESKTKLVRRQPGQPGSTQGKDGDDRVRSRDNARLDMRSRDSGGRTPLHRFAKKGDADVVRKLIAEGAEVNVQDHAGWSPLHEACLNGHLQVAQMLLRHGANINIQAANRETPLHDAVENGHQDVVRYLIRHGADPFLQDEQGLSPLDHARNGTDNGAMEKLVIKESRRIQKTIASKRPAARERKRVIGDDDEEVSETEPEQEVDDPVDSDAGSSQVDLSRPTMHHDGEAPVKKARRESRSLSPSKAMAADPTAVGDEQEIKQDYDIKIRPSSSMPGAEATDTASIQFTTTSSMPTGKSIKRKKLVSLPRVDDTRAQGTPVLSLTIEATISHLPPLSASLASSPLPISVGSVATYSTAPAPLVPIEQPTTAPSPRAPVNPAKYLPLLSIQIPPSICYYVIDVQVLLLLGLPSQHTLYERYPHLLHRSATVHEKEYLRPLSEYIMPVLHTYYQMASAFSPPHQPQPAADGKPSAQSSFKDKQLVDLPITFLALDEILAMFRRDFPDLIDILRTHMFEFPLTVSLTSAPPISAYTSIPALKPPRFCHEDAHLLPPKLAYKAMQQLHSL
ncbi:hypothetical protein RI367_002827 [Sorochytrium milnesiophthora]